MTTRSIPAEGTVALDAVAFAYYFESRARYVQLSRVIFRRLANGVLSGVASTLVFSEILVPYFRASAVARPRPLIDAVRGLPNLTLVDATQDIATAAARIRAAYKLRTPDAIHVATALAHGADWFVTNDRRLRHVEPEGIRVWLFDDHLDAVSG